MKRNIGIALLASGLVGMAMACSSVLGFDALTLDPNAEGGAPSEGGPGADGPIGDGPINAEGGPDAPTCTGVDLTQNENNCGRCGHACLGGGCENSQCKAIKLADGLAVPEGLVVDATDVFVAEYDQNRISKFGKDKLGACASVPIPTKCYFTTSNSFKPTALGIDATNVYWTTTGSSNAEIRTCPRNGCGASPSTLVAHLGVQAFAHNFGNDLLPLDLVVKDGQVFWPESTGGAIRSAPAAGGGPTTTYLENSSYMPVAITVDDSRIFFTDDTNQHATQIASVPRSGAGTIKVISDTPSRPYGIGLTSTGNLFWTVPFVSEEGDGLVQAASKDADGGAPVGSVATSLAEPHALLVDATNVYWLETGDPNIPNGLLLSCPLAGCPTDGPIVLARDQRVPKHITQDDSAIYWSNEGLFNSSVYDGQVWKIAKP